MVLLQEKLSDVYMLYDVFRKCIKKSLRTMQNC